MQFQTETLDVPGYESVVVARAPQVGLQSIIAIHNTNLGPACGGVRMWPYKNMDEALDDVLRLSKGMSYKSSLAGIGFGGGKSVLLGEPASKTSEMMQAFGAFVNSFGGKYIAAKDMNIDGSDLASIRTQTEHVLGVDGEPGSSGDPSPVTARGVFRAIEATVEELTGHKKLDGMRVALQGVGHVGYPLAEAIVRSGGRVVVCDPNPKSLERARTELGAEIVGLDEIYGVDCDIFSPGARGAVINPQTISQLKCKAIVGCANNQLQTPEDGYRLHEKGILYAPDFAINSGGIINIFVEFEGYNADRALKMADAIYSTTRSIYRRSREKGLPPFVVADHLAEERIYGEQKS